MLETKECIEIILLISSWILSFLSIVFVFITIRQNSKMIKNSTRPYVVALAQTTNFQNPMFYLVVKNYGASAAVIKKMDCDLDLGKISFIEEKRPFNSIEGALLAPGQNISCCLDTNKIDKNNIRSFTITLTYTDNIRKYKESYPINYKGYVENFDSRSINSQNELRTISYTLQDFVTKQF